jgi:hypothetical protein
MTARFADNCGLGSTAFGRGADSARGQTTREQWDRRPEDVRKALQIASASFLFEEQGRQRNARQSIELGPPRDSAPEGSSRDAQELRRASAIPVGILERREDLLTGRRSGGRQLRLLHK